MFEEKGVFANSERLIFIIPGRKSRENFGEAIQELERCMEEAERTVLIVQVGAEEVHCQMDSHMSQMERVTVVSGGGGGGGSFCTGCTVFPK